MIDRLLLHNGEVKSAGEPSLFPGQLGLLAGWGVFSTLKIVDGGLFAWERHWARLSRDAAALNIPMPASPAQVESDLLRLAEANRRSNGTVRIVIVRNTGGLWEGPSGGLPSDLIALTTGLKAWGQGVRLGVQPHARYAQSEFTTAKVLSWSNNLRWAERAHEQGFDEVILLNEFGRVAECTSANIFMVTRGEVVTPPVSEGCLPGITREVLLEAVEAPGVRVSEHPLSLEDLYAADEVFITSSTRDLLPVLEIAGRRLNRGFGVSAWLAAAFHVYQKNHLSSCLAAPGKGH